MLEALKKKNYMRRIVSFLKLKNILTINKKKKMIVKSTIKKKKDWEKITEEEDWAEEKFFWKKKSNLKIKKKRNFVEKKIFLILEMVDKYKIIKKIPAL